jgi:hypothetical protein
VCAPLEGFGSHAKDHSKDNWPDLVTDWHVGPADQLVAVKLNIANSADETPVTSTIADADAVFSLQPSKLPYRVRTNTTNGQRMVNDAATLESVRTTADKMAAHRKSDRCRVCLCDAGLHNRVVCFMVLAA